VIAAQLSISAAEILLVFYLVLLVKWTFVRRPIFYLFGAMALGLWMLLGLGSLVSDALWWHKLLAVFQRLLTLAVFLAGVIACYGADLPVKIPGDSHATNTGGETPGRSAGGGDPSATSQDATDDGIEFVD
jgi:hypothetical protein